MKYFGERRTPIPRTHEKIVELQKNGFILFDSLKITDRGLHCHVSIETLNTKEIAVHCFYHDYSDIDERGFSEDCGRDLQYLTESGLEQMKLHIDPSENCKATLELRILA